jgi:hypothetical protein
LVRHRKGSTIAQPPAIPIERHDGPATQAQGDHAMNENKKGTDSPLVSSQRQKPLFLRQQGIAGKTSLPTLRGAPDHDPCAN